MNVPVGRVLGTKCSQNSDASFWAKPEYGKLFGRILGILSLSPELCNTKNMQKKPAYPENFIQDNFNKFFIFYNEK